VKKLRRIFFAVVGVVMGMFIYGCSTLAIIPTTTNPALEQVVGLKVPHVKMLGLKVTLQGFNDGLEALADFEHDITYPAGKEWEKRGRERSGKVATTILAILSAAGLGGSSLLPVALKKVPAGYTRDDA